jgi:hypothetical protein
MQTNEDKIAAAQKLKEEGNGFVKQQDYSKALFAYHKVPYRHCSVYCSHTGGATTKILFIC